MSTKTSRGVQSTAGGDTEEKAEKLSLPDAVVAYLDLRDGPTGSLQDYQSALDNVVAALPASHMPQSLVQLEQPEE